MPLTKSFRFHLNSNARFILIRIPKRNFARTPGTKMKIVQLRLFRENYGYRVPVKKPTRAGIIDVSKAEIVCSRMPLSSHDVRTISVTVYSKDQGRRLPIGTIIRVIREPILSVPVLIRRRFVGETLPSSFTYSGQIVARVRRRIGAGVRVGPERGKWWRDARA